MRIRIFWFVLFAVIALFSVWKYEKNKRAINWYDYNNGECRNYIVITSAGEQTIDLPLKFYDGKNPDPILELTDKGEIILRGKLLAKDKHLGVVLRGIYGGGK